MIDLKDDKYSVKRPAIRETILEFISDYDIFKYYIPDITIGPFINSPLRSDDHDASFGLFWSEKYDQLMFKDMGGAGDRGDSIHCVSLLKNCSYKEALSIIAKDFRLDDKLDVDQKITTSERVPIIYPKDYVKTAIKEDTVIQITERGWNEADKRYWSSYGITKQTLIKFRVKPIRYIFINDNVFAADGLAYAYLELKDGLARYKIYQPRATKGRKWWNNFVDGTLSGFSQLPESGDLLVIASSLKDAMCIHDHGYTNVISPQTENYIFNEHVLNDLKTRFRRVVLFYDNDAAGFKASSHMKELFNLDFVVTGTPVYKDPSDYRKAYGKEKFEQLLKQLL